MIKQTAYGWCMMPMAIINSEIYFVKALKTELY